MSYRDVMRDGKTHFFFVKHCEMMYVYQVYQASASWKTRHRMLIERSLRKDLI